MSYKTAITQNYHLLFVQLFLSQSLYMHLIVNFTCNDTILSKSLVVAVQSFSIELIEAIVHKYSKKGVFEILEALTRNHPQRNTTSDNRM